MELEVVGYANICKRGDGLNLRAGFGEYSVVFLGRRPVLNLVAGPSCQPTFAFVSPSRF